MAFLDYLVHASVATAVQLGVLLGPALLLAGLLHFLSRWFRVRAARVIGANFYIYLTAPGVVVHELGHVLFCLVFGHKIVRVQLFKPDSDGTLGRVDHSYNPRNVYQAAGNFFIGTGPIWLGTATIYWLSQALLGPAGAVVSDSPIASAQADGDLRVLAEQIWQSALGMVRSLSDPATLGTWQHLLFIYLAFCIGSHITLSKPDIAGAWRGFLWVAGLLLAFNLITLWSGSGWEQALGRLMLHSGAAFYATGVFVSMVYVTLATVDYLLGFLTRRR